MSFGNDFGQAKFVDAVPPAAHPPCPWGMFASVQHPRAVPHHAVRFAIPITLLGTSAHLRAGAVRLAMMCRAPSPCGGPTPGASRHDPVTLRPSQTSAPLFFDPCRTAHARARAFSEGGTVCSSSTVRSGTPPEHSAADGAGPAFEFPKSCSRVRPRLCTRELRGPNLHRAASLAGGWRAAVTRGFPMLEASRYAVSALRRSLMDVLGLNRSRFSAIFCSVFFSEARGRDQRLSLIRSFV